MPNATNQAPDSIQLVLVRHGESIWSAEGKVQGHNGPGLSERGVLQSHAIGKAVAGRFPQVRRIISSDLPRARETSEVLRRYLPAATMSFDADLREADIGAWDGKRFSELVTTDPETFGAWMVGQDVRRGAGETNSAVLSRVLDAIQRLVATASDPDPILVVTHGSPIRFLVADMLGLFPARFRRLEAVRPGSITVVCGKQRTPTFAGRLTTYNDYAHVDQLIRYQWDEGGSNRNEAADIQQAVAAWLARLSTKDAAELLAIEMANTEDALVNRL